MQTKTCSNPDCQMDNPQPIENFHRNNRSKDGLNSQCKTCRKAAARRYRQSAKGKATAAAYRASEHGQEVIARTKRRYCKSQKNKDAQARYRHSRKGQAQRRRANLKELAEHPEQVKARKALNHEVEKGRMPPASDSLCYYCGEQASEYHHHKGYEQEHWLDVIPVCSSCHRVH